MKYLKVALSFTMLSLFSISASEATELYLVVGSNRTAGKLYNPYLESYHHGTEMDFTHLHTFEGKAATLDLRPDKGIERHFPSTDVCSYIPKQQIAAVFMEVFPSRGVRTRIDLERQVFIVDPEQGEKIRRDALAGLPEKLPVPVRNAMAIQMLKAMKTPPEIDHYLMPNAIANLAKHMKSGATLKVEHIPLVAKLQATPYSIDSMRSNPFHLYVKPKFCELIETAIALLKNDETEAWGEERLYMEAVQNVQAAMAISTGEIRLDRDDFFKILSEEMKSLKQDFCNKDKEFVQSLAVVVAIEVTRIQQEELNSPLNTFLREAGFISIKHSKGLNPYNGRSNSWVISAVKM
jgi:hypothetical protein